MPKRPNILEGESPEDLNALSESLYSQLEPATEMERSLVDMMVHHEWFRRRAVRMREALSLAARDGMEPDAKRLSLVERYYKTHERAYAQTKRELDSMRKHKRRMEALSEREAAAIKSRQRQWEQIFKKMPTLTDWVN